MKLEERWRKGIADAPRVALRIRRENASKFEGEKYDLIHGFAKLAIRLPVMKYPRMTLLCLLAILPFIPGLHAKDRPNIVFIISDDLGTNGVGYLGNPEVRTPAVDALAARSLILERMYVASPSCAPSRGALISGLMPARNGAEPNHTYVREDVRQLPAYMRELGYEIAAIGKIQHGGGGTANFDHEDRAISPESIGKVDDYLAQRDAKKPLLLMVGIRDPHTPWPTPAFDHYDAAALPLPARFLDTPESRARFASYYSDVEMMDVQVAATLAAVEKHLGPETIIFFSSDHGSQLPFGKWNNYEFSLRVPTLAYVPGMTQPGTRSEALLSFVDWVPTLIELAGGDPPVSGYAKGEIDGHSFVGVLTGESNKHRDYVFGTNSSANHHTYPLRSVVNERYRYVRNVYPELNFTVQFDHNPEAGGHPMWRSWVELAQTDVAARKFVADYHQRPAEELYDLEADPTEERNLAGDPGHAQTLRKLRAVTDNWIRQSGDQLLMYGPPIDILLPLQP